MWNILIKYHLNAMIYWRKHRIGWWCSEQKGDKIIMGNSLFEECYFQEVNEFDKVKLFYKSIWLIKLRIWWK